MINLFKYLLLGFCFVSLPLYSNNHILTTDLVPEKENEHAAVISIDISDKKPVKMKFGFNEYVISSSPYHRFNEQPYVDAMKESGASVMRFPGGTIANWYDWKDDDFMTDDIKSIIPEDMVKRDAYKSDEEYQTTLGKFKNNYLAEYIGKGTQCTKIRGKYGYEDFLDMTRKVGADIYYVGNVSFAPGGKNPADHLVDWMLNLRKRGMTVNYLELGNELITPSGANNNQAIPNQMYNLDRYMAVSQDISRRVRKIFPDIKIGILADGLGNKLSGDQIDLLDRRIHDNYPTDFYDAIVIHTYLRTTDNNTESNQVRMDKLFALSKKIVESSIDHWKTVFPGKEVWMTETGYIAGNKNDENNFTTTMFTAMLEADYYLRWTNNDDIATSYIKFFSISPNQSIKCTRFWSDNNVINTPVAYAYSLVAGAVKNSAWRLSTDVKDGGGYPVKTASWIQDKDAAGNLIPGKGKTLTKDITVDYITASAFLSIDESTIYIPFINKSQTTKDIRLEIKGLSLDGLTAEIQNISGDLSDRNTVENPQKVVPVISKTAADSIIHVPGNSVGVIKIGI